ncbi:RNA polymerase sigma factor, sigma-70 family [Chitinophaga costaii]|uniref:RNA polymerase sigma factor, sigma-70 family n=2 Tax=Chitinophaga costaii TaxID=1335309 RepID=A0A1C4G1Z8_9BACT|nr:RNA polymerase sigma factor, sigma-70 family [Chitinophaga costaii]
MQVVTSRISLWERFQQGDREAFALLYREHVDDLYHYGMHFCADGERVKDCLQDLFQDLWQSREHLSANIRNIRYYLLSSLRRRLLRSLHRDRNWFSRPDMESFELECTLPREHQLINDESAAARIRDLQRALSGLTRRQREAIYLRFYQDLSYDEVAELMVMKIDSVYNTISKAIGALKKALLLPLFLLLLQYA